MDWSDTIVRGTVVETHRDHATLGIVAVLMGDPQAERIQIEPNSFRSCTGQSPLFRRTGDRRIFFLRHTGEERYVVYGGPQGAAWAGTATDDEENRSAIAAEMAVVERAKAARQPGSRADERAGPATGRAAGAGGTPSEDDGRKPSAPDGGAGGRGSEKTGRAMRTALSDPEESVRVAALESLRQWAQWDSDPELMRLVAARASDDSATVRAHVADRLGDLSTREAARVLASMLADGKQAPHVLDKAVEGLVRLYSVGGPGCAAEIDGKAEALARAAVGARQRTSLLAIDILRSSATDAAGAGLEILSRNHPDEAVRRRALRHLRKRPNPQREEAPPAPGEGEGRTGDEGE